MKASQLEQLNYKFNENVQENVFLYINGFKTTIEIGDLFIKINRRVDSLIKGWSIIQNFEEIKNHLKEDNISIDFKNEENNVVSFETERPFWQLNDKEIDSQDFNTLIDKIKELSREISERSQTAENGPGAALPGSIFNNEKYQKLSDRLKKGGYNELRKDNYCLFLDSDESSNDDLAIEITEEGYNILQILKSEEENFFIKDTNNNKELKFVVEQDDLNGVDRLMVYEPEIEITTVVDKDDDLGM
jgi:hypothetical protein